MHPAKNQLTSVNLYLSVKFALLPFTQDATKLQNLWPLVASGVVKNAHLINHQDTTHFRQTL